MDRIFCGGNNSGRTLSQYLEVLRMSGLPKWDPKEDGNVGRLFIECLEKVARCEAERTGFDMYTEPHALMRMLMVVFSSAELRDEAISLLKDKMGKRSKREVIAVPRTTCKDLRYSCNCNMKAGFGISSGSVDPSHPLVPESIKFIDVPLDRIPFTAYCDDCGLALHFVWANEEKTT